MDEYEAINERAFAGSFSCLALSRRTISDIITKDDDDGKRRIDDLFEYMNLLIYLRDDNGGYICTREIGECISEIRAELGIDG